MATTMHTHTSASVHVGTAMFSFYFNRTKRSIKDSVYGRAGL
jgi:hypothetical protein